MKKMTIIGGGYSEYSAPSVTALEVVAEKGFAASIKNGDWKENDDYE